MSERLSFWFPVLLLALLAGLTFWLDSRVSQQSASLAAFLRHDPDFIVENFSATRMGEDGAPRYTLAAAKMQHYPDDNSTHLDAPRFVRFGGSAPISMRANHALISSNGENAYFSEDVQVVRAAFDRHSELWMRTNFLHLIPELDLAKTDQAVEIVDDYTKINAVGLELNSATRIVKLLSHVKGSYEKPRAR